MIFEKNVHNSKATRQIFCTLHQIIIRTLMFYICKFHDKTDDATRYPKCWLNFLLKCYIIAFVSAEAHG